MPLPNNTADSWKTNEVHEEGNIYYSILGLINGLTKVPQGFVEDIASQGVIRYGKENIDVLNRWIQWEQQSPGVWTVSVGPSNRDK